MLKDFEKMIIEEGARHILKNIPNCTSQTAKETFVIAFSHLNQEETEEAFEIIDAIMSSSENDMDMN